jgi:hypothetical protein
VSFRDSARFCGISNTIINLRTESSVTGVELIGSEDPEFSIALAAMCGRDPDDILRPALPYSVIARINSARTVALLGVRFDMRGGHGKAYSVVHYADSLRSPEKADLTPGGLRFVCAEPLYTSMVLRRESQIDPRGPMNLANLKKALSVRASVDCVAYCDGQFCGPDSLGAFDRLTQERTAEEELIAGLAQTSPDKFLLQAMEQPAMRSVARRFYQALIEGGNDLVRALAASHRYRVALWR